MTVGFYARDAMLARALSMALCLSACPSVSLSVTSRFYIETDGRVDLVFGMQVSYDQSYAVLFLKNSGIYKNKGTSLRNLFPKLRT